MNKQMDKTFKSANNRVLKRALVAIEQRLGQHMAQKKVDFLAS